MDGVELYVQRRRRSAVYAGSGAGAETQRELGSSVNRRLRYHADTKMGVRGFYPKQQAWAKIRRGRSCHAMYMYAGECAGAYILALPLGQYPFGIPPDPHTPKLKRTSCAGQMHSATCINRNTEKTSKMRGNRLKARGPGARGLYIKIYI